MDHGENCIMKKFVTCIPRRILLWLLNQRWWNGWDMGHAWVRG